MSQIDITKFNKDGADFVLIPTSNVTFLTTNLSINNQQDLQAALPYALEDEVVQNVEDLHFAWTRASHDPSQIHVAVVSHSIMRALKDELGDTKVTVQPNVLSLPLAEEEWTVVLKDERALVRTALYDGFECHKDTLFNQIKLYLRGDSAPKSIRFWYTDEQDLELMPEALKPLIEAEHYQEFEPWLTKYAMPASGLNLLSGEYELSKAGQYGIKRWAPALILILLSAIVHFGYSWYQIFEYESKNQQLAEQSEQLFREAFPQVSKIVRPRFQAEQELKKLGTGGDTARDNPFYEIYGGIVKTSNTFPDLKLLGYSWRNGRFDYQLEAQSMGSIEAFNQKLNELGFLSEVSNFVNDKGKAKSKLVVKAEQ